MSQQAILFLMCVFKRYPFCSGLHLKLANIPLHSISWKQNIRNDIIWRLFSWFLWWFLTIWQNLISCFSRSYNFWRWCACFWYRVLLWIISLRQYNQWGPVTVPNRRPYETFLFLLTNPSDAQLCLICKYGFMSWVFYSCEFYMGYRTTDNICIPQFPWLLCHPLLICNWSEEPDCCSFQRWF